MRCPPDARARTGFRVAAPSRSRRSCRRSVARCDTASMTVTIPAWASASSQPIAPRGPCWPCRHGACSWPGRRVRPGSRATSPPSACRPVCGGRVLRHGQPGPHRAGCLGPGEGQHGAKRHPIPFWALKSLSSCSERRFLDLKGPFRRGCAVAERPSTRSSPSAGNRIGIAYIFRMRRWDRQPAYGPPHVLPPRPRSRCAVPGRQIGRGGPGACPGRSFGFRSAPGLIGGCLTPR